MIKGYRPEREATYKEIIAKYKRGNHTKHSLHTLAGYVWTDVQVAFEIMKYDKNDAN